MSLLLLLLACLKHLLFTVILYSQIVDGRGEVKAWVDASETGSGNWLKYVRSCSAVSQRNVMAVQCKEEIYYKATEDIAVGKELLLFNDDAVIPENEGLLYNILVCNITY